MCCYDFRLFFPFCIVVFLVYSVVVSLFVILPEVRLTATVLRGWRVSMEVLSG